MLTFGYWLRQNQEHGQLCDVTVSFQAGSVMTKGLEFFRVNPYTYTMEKGHSDLLLYAWVASDWIMLILEPWAGQKNWKKNPVHVNVNDVLYVNICTILDRPTHTGSTCVILHESS